MTMLDRGARSFLLAELLQGMWLTFRYMFKSPVTINYPYEKGPLSPRPQKPRASSHARVSTENPS